ncbi:unnamed protein product, partial [marine sediment metagenome]
RVTLSPFRIMAAPQTENGYLKIAMEIVEALARHRIPGQEMQLIWVLLRKTWGWNKKADHISLSQYAKLTGIDRSKCSHLLQSLVTKNIIKKGGDQKVNSNITKYRFNKDYETWKTSDQKVTGGDQKVNKVSPKRSTKPVTKRSPTIDNIDTIQYIMSELLFSLIKKRRETFKKPDLNKWSKHIDLMIRVDKRDPEEIEKIIQWCQRDDFWQNNILSTDKLRKQYDILAIQMDK